MKGIDLNKPIEYKHSSLRFFEQGEHHCTRFCATDVIVLVYEGILRFSEENVEHEIYPGEYYIQRRNLSQKGEVASDSPKYLYIHFLGDWTENDDTLPLKGKFHPKQLMPLMEELDGKSHMASTYIEKSGLFFTILSQLYRANRKCSIADKIAGFINEEYLHIESLDMLCEKFNFSKNHIINLFKRKYGVTPFTYINRLKIKHAMHLLEATSNTIESIACESGFHEYSHFYRLFCRENGISPMDWRNNIPLQFKRP